MATVTTNLGVVTAYGDALAGGYTGTKAEFQTAMNNYAQGIANASEALAKSNANLTNTADTYSASATYAVGDYVLYGNQLYKCTTAITTAEAWTSGHWTAVNIGDGLVGINTDIGNLNNHIVANCDNQVIQFIKNHYVVCNQDIGQEVNLTPISSYDGYQYSIVECSEGDVFVINGVGGVNPRLWAFIDANNLMLSKSGSNTQYDMKRITAPENAAKIIINFSGTSTNPLAIKGELVNYRLDNLTNNLSSQALRLQSLASSQNDLSFGYITSTREQNSADIDSDNMKCALKSIVLHGATTETLPIIGFDKTYVLDGSENWRVYSTYTNSYRGPNVLGSNLPEYSAGISDGFYVQLSGSSTKNSMRLGSELFLINTKFETVADLKAYLAANPVRIWYRSENYTATENQYYACSIKQGSGNNIWYPAIGTTQKISPLYEGDTLDFVSGLLTRSDESTEIVPINRTPVDIVGSLTLSSQGSITVQYAKDLAKKFVSITGSETPPPMLTIIDDDGHNGFYDIVLPIIISKKVPIATAIVTNRANGDTESTSWMDWTKILECYENGAEVLCHNYTHMTATEVAELTDYEMQMVYQKAKNALREHGITSDLLVYNGATGDYTQAQKGAKRVFRGAILPGGSVSNFTDGGDRWGIHRYGVNVANVSSLYALIDKVKSEGGWMVWMVHTSGELTADTINNLSLAIDYARAQEVAIVTAECGFDYYVDRFWER